jgi:hypothetical protein
LLRVPLNRSYLKRTIRPLYSWTAATPKSQFIDPAWDSSIPIYPGMCLMKTVGENVTLVDGTGDPYGLSAFDEVNGIKRLGVGMIGPIQLKLRYQGITRNVLVEDPVTPGTPVEYDVWDDLGQAYIMSGHDGEVRITPFEGKRVRVGSSASPRARRSARKT